jgi:two-component system, cell cycle response regulator CtrA
VGYWIEFWLLELGFVNLSKPILRIRVNGWLALEEGAAAIGIPPGTVNPASKGISMRVLLIEDDTATAQSIELMLKSEGFNVYTTDLGEEGVDLGKLYDYDIILLDLNLPDMSGYEVLKSLRVSKVGTPILILSGLAGIEDKVKGLGFGADDYMTKPFHKDELVARIHAVVRRSKGHAQSVILTGELLVNLDTKTVEVGGQRVHLTGKEYQMLELLSLRKGTTLTKEMFLNHLYGGMDEPELKIIDVFICKLRKKLANAAEGKNFIETVWGRGYVLREGAPPMGGMDDEEMLKIA